MVDKGVFVILHVSFEGLRIDGTILIQDLVDYDGEDCFVSIYLSFF